MYGKVNEFHSRKKHSIYSRTAHSSKTDKSYWNCGYGTNINCNLCHWQLAEQKKKILNKACLDTESYFTFSMTSACNCNYSTWRLVWESHRYRFRPCCSNCGPGLKELLLERRWCLACKFRMKVSLAHNVSVSNLFEQDETPFLPRPALLTTVVQPCIICSLCISCYIFQFHES